MEDVNWQAVPESNKPRPRKPGHDFDESWTALQAWRLGTLREWKARTVRIMRQRKNLAAVALVADKLLVHTGLGASHVDGGQRVLSEAAD
jgi:hypothetical protein